MDWIAKEFPNETQLAPEDLVVHMLRDIYAGDPGEDAVPWAPGPILSRIFGDDHIVASSLLAPPDLATPPSLIVTSMSGVETQRPGTLTNDIGIYTVIRFEMPIGGILAPYSASLPTLLRYLNTLLSADGIKFLNVTLNGQTFPLATASEPGPVSYRLEPVGDQGRSLVYDVIKEWKYRIEVDPATGRPKQIVLAGG